jgi:hypothetical protein
MGETEGKKKEMKKKKGSSFIDNLHYTKGYWLLQGFLCIAFLPNPKAPPASSTILNGQGSLSITVIESYYQ